MAWLGIDDCGLRYGSIPLYFEWQNIMKYIANLWDGEQVRGIYLCKQKTSAVTKTGKPYENLVLQDKTGTIDAKIWDPHSNGIKEFEVMDYVDIGGEVTTFNGGLQLNIRNLRRADEGEYSPADYLPCSTKNIDEMYGELMEFVNSVKNAYLHTLLEAFFVKDEAFVREFKRHSAAKSVHHSFIGGLLEHILSVTKLCGFYAKQYPILNRDLMITSAIFHDIGKVYELSAFPQNDFTDEGQLLGHIMVGYDLISKKIAEIPGFPEKMARELKHCILAHHGELEYGSPKKPALIEALAIHLADNTDAKMETMTELLLNGKPQDGTEWLGYQKLLDTKIRKTDVY